MRLRRADPIFDFVRDTWIAASSNQDQDRKEPVKKIAIVLAALVAGFVGVGGILPALAKVRDTGAIPSAFVVSYTLGVFLLTILATSAVSYTLTRRNVVSSQSGEVGS